MTTPTLKAASAYKNVGLQTRAVQHDQYQLVVMMFEGALENLNRARGAMEQGQVVAKIEHITKAIRIVQEGLRTSLDLENGSDLAANLANLYDYCVMRMTQANASNNVGMLLEVSGLLQQVADAWKELRPGSVASAEAAPVAPAQATPAAAASGNKTLRQFTGMYGSGMAATRPAMLAGA
ncbi:MAG TPA: flagellar export chaperone FliS [Macromonas sp.]|nr:flagellar export chaperone FliS [Macromonas sp.]